jgi:multicomponent K+:H+ antiporter subunit G
MMFAVELVIAGLLVLGGIFGLVGSYGLIKLQDTMQRLHAPTKATTIGVGTALIASSADLVFQTGVVTGQEVLVAIFLFLTAPLSALYLAKAHIFRTFDRSDLPDPQTGTPWESLEDQTAKAGQAARP